MLRPSGVSFTWLAYFSVASLYAFGHSVLLSPGATSARTAVGRIASMNVAALASTSHQPGLFDMVASPWFWVRVGGSKPPGSYTAYCPNVNLGAASSASGQRRRILASLAEAGAAGTAEAD